MTSVRTLQWPSSPAAILPTKPASCGKMKVGALPCLVIHAPVSGKPTLPTGRATHQPASTNPENSYDSFDTDLQGDVDMLIESARNDRTSKTTRKSPFSMSSSATAQLVTPGEVVTDDPQWMRYASLLLWDFFLFSGRRFWSLILLVRLSDNVSQLTAPGSKISCLIPYQKRSRHDHFTRFIHHYINRRRHFGPHQQTLVSRTATCSLQS